MSRHHNQYCDIEFIGVWDTVGTLGVPFKAVDMLVDWIPFFRHQFHDTALSDNVKHGCQALSLDDERLTFHPTFWDERELQNHQRVEQVWFPGVHTDVGGGYPEHGVADITLEWMVRKASDQGLLIYPKHKIKPAPDQDGMIHDSSSLFRKKQRCLTAEIIKPVIHQSVLDRKLDQRNQPGEYKPWVLEESHDVEPWK